MKRTTLVTGDPTPTNPEIYNRRIMMLSGDSDFFIIPKKWKSRIDRFFGKNIRLAEVRDCGGFLIVLPRLKKPPRTRQPRLRSSDPTPEKPDVFFQVIMRLQDRGGFGFVVPARWRRRTVARLGGDSKEIEIRDCGQLLILKLKRPKKKIGIAVGWDEEN